MKRAVIKFNIPLKNRNIEKLINPYEVGWRDRYYTYLFHQNVNDNYKKKVCTNYLEGLEWTMNYYTSHCKDWRWCYKYNYPPLLKDLVSHIPHWETEMIAPCKNIPVTPYVQLSYVLPRQSLHLLPKEIYETLMKERENWYPTDAPIQWSFCKYFWESHVELPTINLDEVEKLAVL